MNKIKIFKNYISYYKVVKDFTIEFNGVELSGTKYCEQDNVFSDYNDGIDFDEESYKIYSGFDEEAKDEIMEFLQEEIEM